MVVFTASLWGVIWRGSWGMYVPSMQRISTLSSSQEHHTPGSEQVTILHHLLLLLPLRPISGFTGNEMVNTCRGAVELSNFWVLGPTTRVVEEIFESNYAILEFRGQLSMAGLGNLLACLCTSPYPLSYSFPFPQNHPPSHYTLYHIPHTTYRIYKPHQHHASLLQTQTQK